MDTFNEIRSRRIIFHDSDKIARILKRHFSSYFESIRTDKSFYRGGSYTSSELFINPKNFVRRSKDTNQIYYALMDHLPSYKDYPSRSKSVVFSNSRYQAADYGTVYKIYPTDTSKIAYTRLVDEFIEFPKIRSELKIKLPTFSRGLALFVELCYHIYENDISPSSSPDILKHVIDDIINKSASYNEKPDTLSIYNRIRQVSELLQQKEIRDRIISTYRFMKSLPGHVVYMPHGITDIFTGLIPVMGDDFNLINYLDKIMDPQSNNILYTTGAELISKYNYLPQPAELWCDGLCYLVNDAAADPRDPWADSPGAAGAGESDDD